MKQFSIKKFLSDDPFETGAIAASAEVEEDDRYNNLTAELVIKDCYKTVTLDFYAGTKEKQQDRLKKIDTLIDVLVSFREALPMFYEEYNAVLERQEERKKKEISKYVDNQENKG